MNQRMPYPVPHGRYFEMGGGPNGGGADSLEWVIFALLLLLILLAIAQIALTLMRRPRFGGRLHKHYAVQGPPGTPGGRLWGRPDPVSVARMRYARGEIGRDEYVQLMQDFGGESEVEPLTPPA